MAPKLLVVFLVLFGIGAALIVVGNRIRSVDAAARRLMWQKYLSALLVSGGCLISAYFGRVFFATIFAVLVAVGLREFFRVVGGNTKIGPWLGALIALSPLVPGAAGYLLSLGGATLYLLVAPIFWEDAHDGLRSNAVTLMGLMYVAFLGSFCLLLGTDDVFFPHFAFFLLVIFANDAFAQLCGRILGKRALAPRLSPNKTIAGSLAAIACTVATAYALRFTLPGWGTPSILGTAVLLSIAGQLGDLVGSSFKRVAGVKDYGTSMLAFGGVVDRFDSFFFAAPVFALVVSIRAAR